jgi:hypothetical protein
MIQLKNTIPSNEQNKKTTSTGAERRKVFGINLNMTVEFFAKPT